MALVKLPSHLFRIKLDPQKSGKGLVWADLIYILKEDVARWLEERLGYIPEWHERRAYLDIPDEILTEFKIAWF